MAKSKIRYALPVAALALGAGVLLPSVGAWAEETEVVECPVKYNEECFKDFGGVIEAMGTHRDALEHKVVLESDLTDEDQSVFQLPKNNVTIDLNGHNLNTDRTFMVYNDTVTFTGKGEVRLSAQMPFLLFGSNDSAAENFTTLNVDESVSLVSTYKGNGWWYMISASRNATPFYQYGTTVNLDGRIYSAAEDVQGVAFYTNGRYPEDSTITYNVGKTAMISATEGAYIAGTTTMNFEGTIVAVSDGIEIRAGNLNINGGKIHVSEETAYKSVANGNGGTNTGAAIAVAQHTTKRPISVSITGGEFEGPVAFSEANPQKNGAESIAKVKASITGGTFKGHDAEVPAIYSEDLTGFVTGGQSNKEIKIAYIGDGLDYYAQDDMYVVDEVTEVSLPEKVYLQVGDTYELTLNEKATTYGTLKTDSDAVTIEGNVITAATKGIANVNFSLNNYVAPVSQTIEVIVYGVTADDSDDAKDDSARATVQSFAAEQLAELIANGKDENSYISLTGSKVINGETYTGIELVKKLLADGATLETALISNRIGAESWESAEAYAEVQGKLAKGEAIAAVYNNYIELYAEDNNSSTYLGAISQLGDAVTVEFEIPEAYLAPADGYTRTFDIVRGHTDVSGSKSADRLGAVQSGNKLTVSSDKFSTFAITYVDTVTTVTTTETTTEAASEDTESAGVGDTGRVTAEGASAMSAGILAAGAVAVIAAIAGAAALIRRK